MRLALRVAFILALALTPQVGFAKGGGGGGSNPPPPPPPSGPSVSSLVLSPNIVTGGATTNATVTLSGAAPAAGARVVLGSSDTTVATVPASMTVAAGASSGTFTVTSRSVAAVTLVSITADYGGLGTGAILQVNAPAGTGGNGVLSGFSISPDTVFGGNPATGTVNLAAPVAGATTVTLTSTDTTVATVPASVSVPSGATSATFTITTKPQSGTGTFSWITATATASFGASMNVNPGPPATAPSIVSVTLAPASTGGGGASTGTVRLSGPANDGGTVTLSSSNPTVVQVPDEIVIVARQATAAFPVTTSVVGAQTNVTITATARSGTQFGSRSATMTVTTAPPPPPDVVRITNGSWQACIIKISATSTNPNAILTLVLADSNSPMFTLDNLGGGRYSGTRAWRPPGTNVPVNLIVRSNFGGQARITLADPQGFVCRADL